MTPYHTHATLSDQKTDTPMAARQAMLGHASARMTMYYTHGQMEDQRRAAEFISGGLADGTGRVVQ